MLLFTEKQMKKLESRHSELENMVRKTEESYLPICATCGSEDTAIVVDNGSDYYNPINGASTKIHLATGGWEEDKYFYCNSCGEIYLPKEREERQVGSECKTSVIAEVIRRLLVRWAVGETPDPWLEFPQKLCCFWFGEEMKALPIGALKILWSWENPLFRRACMRCGSPAFAVAFGGTQRSSTYHYTCITCNTSWTMEGNDGAAGVARVLQNSPLNRYQFRMTDRNTNGRVSSDGAALLRELGLSGGLESLDHPVTIRN